MKTLKDVLYLTLSPIVFQQIKTRLEELSLEIQDDIRMEMDGHEEVFDPDHLCDIVEHNFNKFIKGE